MKDICLYNSEIRDGKPWTRNDESLFTDLTIEEQKKIRTWITFNLRPRKTPTHGHTSYGIKHILEHDTGIYTTNNQFKHAMLIAGYEPVDEHKLNWNYRLSTKSRAFDYKRRGYIY